MYGKKLFLSLGLVSAICSVGVQAEDINSTNSIDSIEISVSYYINALTLNVRDAERNILGRLSVNDEVTVISTETPLGGDYVEIDIGKNHIKASSSYYVSYKFLTTTKEPTTDFKYFVVQNIATEKVRIYEKICENDICANKMVFETEVAVGENAPKTKSVLGRFSISRWHKFYQDGAQHYPSWYSENLRFPPKAGSSALAWTKKKYLHNGQKSGTRGAFGWYTAYLGPNASYQWMHGTIGWGKDKDKFIKQTKGFWANVFADPRSHGCTRLNNEAIAYARSILPVGTPVYKVYAIEKLHDSSRSRYNYSRKPWDYILTTDKDSVSDRNYVLENLPSETFLERGSFDMDTYPSIVSYKKKPKKTESGNTYGISSYDMKGVFYIDIGMFENYSHPRSLRVRGYKDRNFPFYVLTKNYSDQLAY
ncbi:MAG: L,D-transpeptidase [Bacteriovoracaceae bacterium]|nr:L,D-transpeptidase [Bacteriovoracaceae bacterium]